MQCATVLGGLDIFAQAGANHPLIKSAQVSVTQGRIVIRFVHRTNANVPIISAIEILPSGSSVPPPVATAPSITAQPKNQTVSVGHAASFCTPAHRTFDLPVVEKRIEYKRATAGATRPRQRPRRERLNLPGRD
jgi:hypothetical protein